MKKLLRWPRDKMNQIVSVKFNETTSRFIVKNREDVIQKHFLKGSFFEEGELREIQKKINFQGLCLDIGANVGNHTIFFATHCGFDQVIPFEPNADAAEMLKKNTELNRLSNVNLQYLGCALGRTDGDGSVVLGNTNNLGAARIEMGSGDITVRHGDTLLHQLKGITFVKVDVEGMEIEVLYGIKNLLTRERPLIYIEVSLRHERAFERWCSEADYKVDFLISERKFKRNVLLRPKNI